MSIKKHFNEIAEIELVYHNPQPLSERAKIFGSKAAYQALISSWDMSKIELQEQFRVLLLDQQNNCLGISTIATGGISACIADLRLVFALAIKAKATGIIISHNHPSGNMKFSEPDKSLTARFREAGKTLDIEVLDHIIVGRNEYLSMADSGLLP